MPGDLLSRLLVHLEGKGERSCVIISGGIGAGKTRTSEQLAAALKERGFSVGGILSPRIIQDGETVGYTVCDLASGMQRPFARLEPPGLAVGRFFVAEEGLAVARSAIERAAATAQVVFVDEVGRLELAGGGLAPAVRVLLRSKALPVLLVRSSFLDAVVCTFSIARFEALHAERGAPPSVGGEGLHGD